MAKTIYITIKLLIKQIKLFQMPNKHIDEPTSTTYDVDIDRVNQFKILGFNINLIFKLK